MPLQTLNKLFIINAGSGFRVLWKAVKTFLDVRTVAKIQVWIIIPYYFILRYCEVHMLYFGCIYVELARLLFQVLGSNYLSVLLEAIEPR